MSFFITITLLILVVLPIIFIVADKIQKENNKLFWETKGKQNFPFKWKGKELWFSRSVAVVGFLYCKNALGEWCVLANKRGNGTPDFQGKWNVPCGYLDFNETAKQSIARECLEETGIKVNPLRFQLEGVSTIPSDNRQNVSLRFYQVLTGTVEDYSNFDTSKMEKDEVDEIKWIPFSKLDEYEWAFDHRAYIQSVFDSIGKRVVKNGD